MTKPRKPGSAVKADTGNARRIELHRARFYDFPSMKLAAVPAGLVPLEAKIEVFETEIVVYLEGVILKLNAATGKLSLPLAPNDEDVLWSPDATWSGQSDPTLASDIERWPAEFLDWAAKVEFFPAHEKAALSLVRSAEAILKEFGRRLHVAVAEGCAQVYGRWDTIRAEPAPIKPDQWVHLVEEHIDLPDGGVRSTLSAAGCAVLSPFVKGHRTQHEASNLARRECKDWLLGVIRDAEGRGRLLVRDLKKVAHEKWGPARLPEREFDRILTEIKIDQKSITCIRPGR